ncbi:Crp/Fnr family transcriptional regulator [Alisedimentitalea sp. MJ-SS2]|uniref:Crp/Fnr family transcriptional regulator n=1 Tax=Aliisedimentitalea sp. MJ-SS2 TaxID=3049795 RepID=UPI00290CC376|nr:Crp/Fnr family transcriptional regulator [Alisedimentitalea sp. MJ-SS2]MDU8929161.1 Crp/Fnr family transcriptional regulator [Alisedimentitalea sp. MJ-SS2]
MTWLEKAAPLNRLDPDARSVLARLTPMQLPAGAVLFHPGEAVKGYAIVLSGRVDVSLTGASGREILLYSVVPGQSCIQSTMGLLGGSDYTAEAVTSTSTELVLLPRDKFLTLVDTSPGFRTIVFRAFADRMQLMMQLLEKVAFQRVECRLAERLVALANTTTGPISITQAELATQVGSAREVISRRLDAWARRGFVRTGRGTVEILDPAALDDIASDAV